jgi:hypothetical protein
VYYVGCNVPWLVVPAMLGWRSFKAITEAVEEKDVSGGRRKLK